MSENKKPALGASWLYETVASCSIFTSEQLSEEQRMFGQTAADFASKEVFPKADELEHKKGEVAAPLLAKAGELGLLSVDIPEEYEGLGLDKVTTTIVTEKISEFGSGSFSTAHGAHTGIGTLPIVYFGTEAQKEKYLPGLGSGEAIGCYCLTEAGSGSDALNAKTKAVLSEDGEHYILNGEKMFITNASFAKTAIVFAKIDGQDFTGFIVEMDWPGVSTGNEEKKMGILGSSTRTVILEDVKVPKENMLYLPGRGHVIAFNILNIGRYKLGAACVGATKSAIRESVVYANQRKQFNTSIGTFRVLREKMANMFVKAYAAESMSYRTAGLLDDAISAIDKSQPDAMEQIVKAIEEYAIEASIMKVWGSEACSYAMDEGVQIHGGYGYIEEYPIERGYRDARINRIFEGTNEINRMLIPGTLLKRSMKGQIPMMPYVMKAQQAAKDPSKLPEKGEGPLADEIFAVELAKHAAAIANGTAIRKYLTKLSRPEHQMVLMAMADLIMEVFALDSAVTRTAQIVESRGEEKARIPLLLTRVFVAETVDKIRDIGARLLANCLEGEELDETIAGFNALLPFISTKTYAHKDELAAHLLERECYNLE
jgi:alkylation response protein AidB-like acyl-CoA dehydrogenase